MIVSPCANIISTLGSSIWTPHTPCGRLKKKQLTQGSMNSKLISSFGTSNWTIYSLCDRSYLKVPQKTSAFANLHSPCVTLSKLFHRGCMNLKWSSPFEYKCKHLNLAIKSFKVLLVANEMAFPIKQTFVILLFYFHCNIADKNV